MPPITALEVELDAARPPILAVAPDDLADGAARWVEMRRDALRTTVAEHGAVLVRGLGLSDHAQVAACFRTLGTDPVSDLEAFAQRHEHAPGVYSSATWPDHQQMCMHHELSYRQEVPATAMFACLTAPASGGVTGLADGAAVLADLPSDVVERFAREGWRLIRTYGGDIGPSVSDGFGTDDRAAVAAYCAANAIDHTWDADGVLHTQQTRPAVITHPVTGRRTWFNQVAFLSEWTIEPEIREFLVDVYGADGLPFTTAYGSGEPLDADLVTLLNDVYDAHTVREPWQAGDLLLVDNLATAHSREPFEGPREVLVGLTDPVRATDLAEPAR